MTNQQILTKAIQKAIDSGLDWIGWSDYEYISQKTSDVVTVVAGKNVFDISIRDIIFNHDFAKALWGEGYEPDLEEFEYPSEFEVIDHKRQYMTINDQKLWDSRSSGWQYHLQEMVIADDPIVYLGEHLPD